MDSRVCLLLALGSIVISGAEGWLFKKRCYREMYKDFQCYGRGHPYWNAPLYPQSPRKQKLHFKLFTTAARDSHVLLHAMDAAKNKDKFLDSGKLAVIIHGFMAHSTKPIILKMKDELLAVVPNVIVVDWKEGAKPPNYVKAAANTRVVGAHLATLIRTLGVDPARVHIIGHSLGAHVAGYAGEKFGQSSFSRSKIGRITGLDPAGPLFSRFSSRVSLDRSDATFVDVIHTDVGTGGFGTKDRIGHVDFYPNGGSRMPGCGRKYAAVMKVKKVNVHLACSHQRAAAYFSASISDNAFTAYSCGSRKDWRHCRTCNVPGGCNRMGYHATPEPAGLFVLATRKHYPY